MIVFNENLFHETFFKITSRKYFLSQEILLQVFAHRKHKLKLFFVYSRKKRQKIVCTMITFIRKPKRQNKKFITFIMNFLSSNVVPGWQICFDL